MIKNGDASSSLYKALSADPMELTALLILIFFLTPFS